LISKKKSPAGLNRPVTDGGIDKEPPRDGVTTWGGKKGIEADKIRGPGAETNIEDRML
jgi:hypothetical protein